ncbi:MAG: isoprenylcysteine carboxylmethyltransferase family protein [Kordiimonadaceae bacterium]|nr:isoprenylcysteine carboxylmethyltransferase family protein [Kordiimonadaceae bacterium]MBT6035035.1 isoprenylcysteine carboxylmethyltransferase family protein [Kordiimonadaceae bacterium]
MIPFVTKTIDSGDVGALGPSLLTNIALVSLFTLTHSVMARPKFKDKWTKIIPQAAERSTYVLVSSLCLIAIYVYWQPMTDIVWQTADSTWIMVLWAALLGGFGIVLITTFMINHFELFGLMQIYKNFTKSGEVNVKFVQPLFYKLVRHPLYTGFIIAFWSTPEMTVGHLLFATLFTAQILIAIPHEEKDLADALGDDYKDYTDRVPMLFPFLKL